jgi:hypothetical protein
MEAAPLNSTEINWTREPNFKFDTEVDALMALEDLGDQLRAAREQVRVTMQYLSAAVVAAGKVREEGGEISFQAIVHSSGVARQTVADMLGRPAN